MFFCWSFLSQVWLIFLIQAHNVFTARNVSSLRKWCTNTFWIHTSSCPELRERHRERVHYFLNFHMRNETSYSLCYVVLCLWLYNSLNFSVLTNSTCSGSRLVPCGLQQYIDFASHSTRIKIRWRCLGVTWHCSVFSKRRKDVRCKILSKIPDISSIQSKK